MLSPCRTSVTVIMFNRDPEHDARWDSQVIEKGDTAPWRDMNNVQ